MNEAYKYVNEGHTVLARGVTTAIYTVNIAQWLARNQVESQACGIDGRTLYQDVGLQIYFYTVIARVGLSMAHKIFKKIAKKHNLDYPLDKTFDLVESAFLEALSMFTYTGGSRYIRLIMPASLYTTMTPAIAGVLASIPLGHLGYKLFFNPSYYRGAYQDYHQQFPGHIGKLLTGLEAFSKSIMMGSLALKVSECVIDTVIDAMRENNLTPEQEKAIFEYVLPIASLIGMLSIVSHPAWKFLLAASTSANVFYSSYNFPLSILTCQLPIELGTAAGFLNGGWTWEFLCAATALTVALPACIKAYRNIYEETTTFLPASVSSLIDAQGETFTPEESSSTISCYSFWSQRAPNQAPTEYSTFNTSNNRRYTIDEGLSLNNPTNNNDNNDDDELEEKARCSSCTLF